MCSFSDSCANSPDGVKMLIIVTPWLTLLASVWLCTRRRTVIRVVSLAEVESLLDGYHYTYGDHDDTKSPPRLNPPEDRGED